MYGSRGGPGEPSDAQAQSAYMNRQTDKVIDKIMEMEPKSVPQQPDAQMEPEELDAPSYPRQRSRAQANPDDDLIKQERRDYSELSEAAANYIEEEQR